MDTLDNVTNQMKGLQGQMSYAADMPSEINSQIQKAYTPALQNSLDVTTRQMGDYLGRVMDTTSMGPGMAGTTAKDLSPMQKMGVVGRELGTMTGQLNASQKYSDYLGAQMNDAYGKATQAAQMGQQALADQYNRLGQQQQMLWQQAEAEKDRALQLQMSRNTGGNNSGFDIEKYLRENSNQGQVPSQDQIISDIQSTANMLKSQRPSAQNGILSYGGQTGDINAFHSQLLNDAKYYGVNLNPEWLWIQLGNTPKVLPAELGSNAYWKPTL